MNRLNRSIRRATGMASIAALVSAIGVPALAQVNPNPSVLNEPRYDGNPGGQIQVVPSTTPSLSEVNPTPEIYSEPNYDGAPNPNGVPVAPANTPSLSGVNPNPTVFNEPRYDGISQNQTPGTNPSVRPGNNQDGTQNRIPGNNPAQPGNNQDGTQNRIPGNNPSVRPGNNQGSNQATDISALDRQFMLLAAQSNNAEIQTSQLALQRSRNDSVRQYAQRMIQEHTLANQRLAAIAQERGFALPTDTDPLNAAIAAELSQLSGTQFDQAYMGAQVNAHLRTLGLLQTQTQQGRNQQLRGYAAQILPNVRDHYQMASRMVPNYNAIDARPEGQQTPNQQVRQLGSTKK